MHTHTHTFSSCWWLPDPSPFHPPVGSPRARYSTLMHATGKGLFPWHLVLKVVVVVLSFGGWLFVRAPLWGGEERRERESTWRLGKQERESGRRRAPLCSITHTLKRCTFCMHTHTLSRPPTERGKTLFFSSLSFSPSLSLSLCSMCLLLPHTAHITREVMQPQSDGRIYVRCGRPEFATVLRRHAFDKSKGRRRRPHDSSPFFLVLSHCSSCRCCCCCRDLGLPGRPLWRACWDGPGAWSNPLTGGGTRLRLAWQASCSDRCRSRSRNRRQPGKKERKEAGNQRE